MLAVERRCLIQSSQCANESSQLVRHRVNLHRSIANNNKNNIVTDHL
jgi:hypothetical protein